MIVASGEHPRHALVSDYDDVPTVKTPKAITDAILTKRTFLRADPVSFRARRFEPAAGRRLTIQIRGGATIIFSVEHPQYLTVCCRIHRDPLVYLVPSNVYVCSFVPRVASLVAVECLTVLVEIWESDVPSAGFPRDTIKRPRKTAREEICGYTQHPSEKENNKLHRSDIFV